jgi:hypothetical protein
MDDIASDDLLREAPAIALFLKCPVRQVYRLAQTGELPIFKIGGILHATKSGLRDAIRRREQEAAARRLAPSSDKVA